MSDSPYAYERDCQARHERSNRAARAAADRAEDNMRRLDKRGVTLADHQKDLDDHETRIRSLEALKRSAAISGGIGTAAGVGSVAAVLELLRQSGIL